MDKQSKIDFYLKIKQALLKRFPFLTDLDGEKANAIWDKPAVEFNDFFLFLKNHKWAFPYGMNDRLTEDPDNFIKFDSSLPDVSITGEGAVFNIDTVYRLEKPVKWLSLNIWVKIPDVNFGWNTILSGGLNSNSGENQILVIYGQKFATLEGSIAINQTLQNNQWYMVTILNNGDGSYSFYLNGVYANKMSPDSNIDVLEVLGADADTNSEKEITNYNEKGKFTISDLAVYDRVLSENEIVTLYSDGRTVV